MVNYNNGKIYKIEDLGGEMCYIGSTTKDYLSKRMVAHRSNYKHFKTTGAKNVTVFQIFDKYGIDNCRIVLIELCPCDTKDELLKREAYYMKLFPCVNTHIPIKSQNTKKEYEQDYHTEHKEERNQKSRQYNSDHKEQIRTYKLEYNKMRVEITKQKVACICGSTFRKLDTNRHEQSIKHINYIANQLTDV